METITHDNQSICPVELAGGLDNSLRKWLQQPEKLLAPFIKPGMTVLDLGCGPGFFTIEIARLLKGNGKVIAADLQEGMLRKLEHKIEGTDIEPIVHLYQCQSQQIGLTEKADFILAFYMIHEVPNKPRLFEELKRILKPNGTIYIVEPRFHVRKNAFSSMLQEAEKAGLQAMGSPSVTLSRTVLLKHTL